MDTKTLIAFLAGAAIGGFAGWYVSKEKYERIANEELQARRIEAEKERERQKKESSENGSSRIAEDYINPRKLARESMEKPSIMDMKPGGPNKVYRDYTSGGEIVQKKEESKDESPYSIPKDQVGLNDYEKLVLTFYADGVLADETDEEVDISATVGDGFEDHIGEYENDAVFIRNDKLETDYEIYVDERTFKEVSGNSSR